MEASSRSSSAFGAAGPALGYLAQVDHALLASLRRLGQQDDFAVSVETFDDIAFHPGEEGTGTERWQSKHSVDPDATLTDASTDLWKTLHNWISELADDSVAHVLLTTAEARGAAAELRPGPGRNPDAALAALERTARTSESETNKPYYEIFLALDQEQRRSFVGSVEVIDRAANAGSVSDEIALVVRTNVVPARRSVFVERLLGWWHERVIAHLESGAGDRIEARELELRLIEIGDELRDDNLPVDIVDFEPPTDDELSLDDRVFVAQLRLIDLHRDRLRNCIFDHNRAATHRSKWRRQRLLGVGELGRYDSELVEEWQRVFLPTSEDEDIPADEVEVRTRARDLFLRLESSQLPRIRPRVQAGYIARGSLHVIADRLEIGWHPHWSERLEDRRIDVEDAA